MLLKATEKKKMDKTRNVRVAAAAIVRPQTTLCGEHGSWRSRLRSSAVKRSIGFTIGFHNHGEVPY